MKKNACIVCWALVSPMNVLDKENPFNQKFQPNYAKSLPNQKPF